MEALRENPPEHFIYLSTFHVYGKKSGEISEETPPLPLNDYGLSHLFAEYYVKQYHKNHGLPYTIIRLSNSYGCPKDYDSSKWYLILNDLSKMAFEESKIELRGNGLASRDFIWMGDVCRVFERLAQHKAFDNTFNLSTGKPTTLLEVAEGVQQAYEEYFDKEISIARKKNDPPPAGKKLHINAEKLKKKIPFETEKHFKAEALKIFDFLEEK